ncbi:MAG: bifunctional diguanylate cyclase/phosphodiesterase [Sphingomonas sp.]|nr:bifunctional diguanylate cyclase/phosphodiesterase [Sphingomonas sp.]
MTAASEEGSTVPDGALTPLFVLSFRQRDELAALAARGGWQVIAARRADGVAERFAASGASVAVVDARGALGDGLAAVAALGGPAAARGAALLVLVSRGDTGSVAAFHDAGATHFLSSPHSEVEFVQALRFAARHAERLAAPMRESEPAQPLGWRLEGRRLVLTPALAALLDLPEVVPPRRLLALMSRADRSVALATARRLLLHRLPTAFAHDTIGMGRVVQHLQLCPASGTPEALIERLAGVPDAGAVMRDAMSGVRDAATARRWLARQLAEGRGQQAALIALNRFDIVNTAYGRVTGDTLLRAVQRRIEEVAAEAFGRGAVVARMGGSDFLLAADASTARMEAAAGRVAEALSRPFIAGGAVVVLGCRIGIASAEPDDDAAALLRRAGEALEIARTSDTLTLYVARAGQPGAIDTLAVDLRQAIDQGEIDIVFQPQVAVATGAITGAEALARWEHPVLGPLGAETLFAAAARADLVIGLSDHIQRIALAQAAAWPAALAGLRLAINLTPADIARPGFADIFLDRVDSSGFARARLTVEVTENGLIEDLGAASGLLATLRQAGCRVAIDDFGTGYSSLAYLKALPLDYLKIDKKLAQDITGSARDRIVVRGVIDMARSLGLSVIAEGVETPEQLDLLAREGCQYYQGFLCAGPVDVLELERLATTTRQSVRAG